MNKKIFAILLISIFLIVSAGFISAAEDSDDAGNASNPIKIKIVWDDKGNTTCRPDQIMVNLLRGGKVVEFINLNESNSWNATFKTQGDDGNYKVQLADDLSNYSVSYNGSIEKGFVINCTLKEAPSKAIANESLDKNDTNGTVNETSKDIKNQTSNNTNKASSSADINKTKTDAGDKNKADKHNSSADNNKTKTNAAGADINNADTNSSSTNNVNNKTPETSNKTDVNSTPKKEEPNNNTQIVKSSKKPVSHEEPQFSINKLRNTGLPIIVVSVLAILGGYAYLRYYRK